MTTKELQQLLDRFVELTILVVGDYFLDQYLVIDPELAETSLETGLESRQVVEVRNSPGAAGTITSNLKPLGVGRAIALGAIGDDGQGYDLRKGLEATGVEIDYLIADSRLMTPTYTKPISSPTWDELERLDIKNRITMPADLEERIIEILKQLVPDVHGVIVQDQVQERNCGVITDRVREEINRLGEDDQSTVWFADSRTRIGEFRNVILKPNREEAVRALHPDHTGDPSDEMLRESAVAFSKRSAQPVFVTLGEKGILCADRDRVHHIPGIPVSGPIDIVGAGDSVSAAVVSALCAGASIAEAAMMGVVASSITVQQIGTTGVARAGEVVRRYEEACAGEWGEAVRG